jgi:hypothetical protein
MPAPAPWAKTKHAVASGGLIMIAESGPEVSLAILSCSVARIADHTNLHALWMATPGPVRLAFCGAVVDIIFVHGDNGSNQQEVTSVLSSLFQ